MATDYLTCGECLREFPLQRITLFIQHKKLDCDDDGDFTGPDPELKCNYCPQGFMTAWALLVHAQLTHNLKIFLEKASKSFLNQVKFPPITKGDKSDASSDPFTDNTDNLPLQSLNAYDLAESKDSPKLSKDNSGTSLLQEMCEIDKDSAVVKENQSQTESSWDPDKMGSSILVTRNILTGVKQVGEKTDGKQSSLDKNAPGNAMVSLNAASQIGTTGQKIKLLPVSANQTTVSFLPKLNVVPMAVSSSSFKSSIIKVLPTTLSQQPGVQSSPVSNTKSMATFVTVLKQEPQKAISSTPNITNRIFTNQTKSLETPTILLPRMISPSSPPVNKIAQLENHSTEVSDRKESIESGVAMMPITSQFPVTTDSSLETSVTPPQDASKQSALFVSPLKMATTTSSTFISPVKNSDKQPSLMDGEDGKDTTNQSEMDSAELDTAGSECCDRQGCGVTVIPGSHENLQECCNAVVPKKRKRHMELKHMPFSWSSSRYARRKRPLSSSLLRSSQAMQKSSTGTIYIDLEPDNTSSGVGSGSGQDGTSFKVTQSASPGVKICTTSNPCVTEAVESSSHRKPHSLILQPGAIFSIPFTYKIPPSKTVLNTLSLPTTKEAISRAGSAQQTASSISTGSVSGNHSKVSKGGDQTVTSASSLSVQDLGQFVQAERVRKDPRYSSKPFQCDKCTMAFNQRIHLKKHMSKHTGIKPYKCGECSYSTVERSHLKVHIRIHTGEKPFKCTYCEYATAQNSTLKIHLKRHHGGKMFRCQTCNKQFTQEKQLKGHKLEHGPFPVTSTEQVSGSNSKTASQQTTAVSQSPPLVQTSIPSQNISTSQNPLQSRYSSIEEVMASTNQQPESSQIDIKGESNQSS